MNETIKQIKLMPDDEIYDIQADPTRTATSETGSRVLEFTDGADAPLVKCVTQIMGYQSGTGTPSPDNIRPIVAYTEGEIEVRGKNLFDKNDPDILTGKALNPNTGDPYLTTSWSLSDYIEIEPLTKYTLTIPQTSTCAVAFYDSSKTYISGNSSFTTRESPANAKYLRFDFRTENIDNVMVEKGETPHDYEPYVRTTHTTTYPSAIYRGSEDVVKGEVTSDMTVIDMGDLTWNKSSTITGTFYATLPDYKFVSNVIMLSSAYNYVGTTMTGTPDLVTKPDCSFMAYYKSRDNYREIYFKDTRFTEATDFANAVDGVMLAYELATPTTSSVTPTNLPIKSLSGYNHIESSTGDMEVEYITQGEQPILDLIKSALGDTYEKTIYVTGLGSVDIGGDLDYNQSIMVTYYITYKYDNVDYCVYESYFGRSAYGSGSWGYGHTLEFAVTDKTPQQYTKGTHLHVGVNSYYGAPLAVGVWCNSEDESHITNIDGLIRVVIDRNPLTIS